MRYVLALLLCVANAPAFGKPTPTTEPRLSARERSALVQPLISELTACIANAVQKREGSTEREKLGDAVVESIPSCITHVHRLIDRYDELYGAGTGEAFFMGPYLDVLPTAVVHALEKK